MNLQPFATPVFDRLIAFVVLALVVATPALPFVGR